MNKPDHTLLRRYVPVLLCHWLVAGLSLPNSVEGEEEIARALTLPDVSGMAWIEDDLFLAVHDAKSNPEKFDWPRVSIARLPKSELEGLTWQTQKLSFPGPEGRSSDLESASRIPGGGFLMAESGQEGADDRRIFHLIYEGGKVKIDSHGFWPVPIKNVEATEVCRVGDRLVFLYAERASDQPLTKLRWTDFSLKPMKFGQFKEVTYKGVDPVGKGARPIVALDVDKEGHLYIVSAFDPGSDDGPYRSVVWRIGQIKADEDGNPAVSLEKGTRLATLDGLKVESIAVCEGEDGKKRIFVGTDDEHFGGVIRPLPSADH